MTPPYDRNRLHAQLKQWTGLRHGWPTEADRAAYRHLVDLPGLTRETLGPARFAHVYHAVVHSAAQLAPHDHWIEAVYENHQRTGYRVLVRDALTALRLHLCHRAAMEGRPLPLAAASGEA